jgi:hypothetical protein
VGDDGATPGGAVVVMDHSDDYSQNLAYDLYDQLGDSGVDLISYPVENAESTLPGPQPDTPAATQVGSLDELAAQVCASMEQVEVGDGTTAARDVIFFTSRSSQFGGLLDGMHDNNDCPDTFTVVGGSAITKIVENRPNLMGEHPGVSLYYAAFASRGVSYNRFGDDFIVRYENAYDAATNTDLSVGTDVSDAALTYDAFTALQTTANYAQRNGFPISADTSAEALSGDEVEFDGASGYIALGNEPLDSEGGGHQRVPPQKPVLVLQAGSGQSRPELACGRFGVDDNRATWGDDNHACPTAN